MISIEIWILTYCYLGRHPAWVGGWENQCSSSSSQGDLCRLLKEAQERRRRRAGRLPPHSGPLTYSWARNRLLLISLHRPPHDIPLLIAAPHIPSCSSHIPTCSKITFLKSARPLNIPSSWSSLHPTLLISQILAGPTPIMEIPKETH